MITLAHEHARFLEIATRAHASRVVGIRRTSGDPRDRGLVSHHDHVHVETIGTMSIGQPAPMARDTIFRIASITKPVVAVAAMILVEECRLRLDDSIESWLPASP
jgi:hypothetical protein